jgi:DNA-binding transcriptional MerR regulator
MSAPARRTLPSKLYYRIGEVAELVGVEPHVLRYWEREFRTIRPTKSPKGQRVYSRRDVETLSRVRELLYGEGFTIAGARKKLQDTDDPSPNAAELPTRTRQALLSVKSDVERFLAELASPDARAQRGSGRKT